MKNIFKRTLEEEYSIKLQHLREAIAEADKAISRDESHVLNSVEELDSFFDAF